MAILGLGSDIVEIERIAGVIERSGDRLARRVLSDAEWQQYQAHQQPVRFLLRRERGGGQSLWHRDPRRTGV